MQLSHGWIWIGIFTDITGCSQRIKRICVPWRKTAGDVLQCHWYLFNLFNILTVKLLEPGLPKILRCLPAYHLLSTCLRKAFLAWQRQPFIPLLWLWSWVLQHNWYMARKETTSLVLPVGYSFIAQRWYWRKNYHFTEEVVGGQYCCFCLHYLMQHGSCIQDEGPGVLRANSYWQPAPGLTDLIQQTSPYHSQSSAFLTTRWDLPWMSIPWQCWLHHRNYLRLVSCLSQPAEKNPLTAIT